MSTDLERELSRRLHRSAEYLVPEGTEPPMRATADRRSAPRFGPDLRWRRPLLVAAAVAAIVVASTVLLVTLPGDDTAAAPDVSTDGRIAYACALAANAQQHGPVDTWEFAVGDPGPAIVEVMGAAGLLGGARGDPDVYGGLSAAAATIHGSTTRLDLDGLQGGLDRLIAGCTDRGLPPAGLDTSDDGRIGYVCALADDVDGRPGGPDTWRPISLEGTDPVWFEIDGIIGMLGASLGTPVSSSAQNPSGAQPGRPNLSGVGQAIYAGVARGDNSKVEKGLNELVARCQDG